MEFILISDANLDGAYPTFDPLVKHSSAPAKFGYTSWHFIAEAMRLW
jgi:hypothetical protein